MVGGVHLLTYAVLEVNGPNVGGRLLVTGSLMGIINSPAVGYYVAGKHGELLFHNRISVELRA